MSFDAGTIDQLATLNPRPANLAAWLIWYLGQFGAHVHVTEGRRSIARQRILFAARRQARSSPTRSPRGT